MDAELDNHAKKLLILHKEEVTQVLKDLHRQRKATGEFNEEEELYRIKTMDMKKFEREYIDV